jgi:hypothetical protein
MQTSQSLHTPGDAEIRVELRDKAHSVAGHACEATPQSVRTKATGQSL